MARYQTIDVSPRFLTVDLEKQLLPGSFVQGLFLCDRQGLIGRQMFAIDGVKLPSNVSKAKSGIRLLTMLIDVPMTLPGLHVPQTWGVAPALSFLAIFDRPRDCVLSICSSGAPTRSPIVWR